MLLKSVLLVVLLSLGSVPLSAATAAAEEQVAQAEEHIVIILGSAYFPQKTTVAEGDVVRFVNVSGRDHTVIQKEGAWATWPMADGEELLVTIEPGMTGEFHGMAKRQINGRFDLVESSYTN